MSRSELTSTADSMCIAEAQQQSAELERLNTELKDSLTDEAEMQETLASLEKYAAKLREETSKARAGKTAGSRSSPHEECPTLYRGPLETFSWLNLSSILCSVWETARVIMGLVECLGLALPGREAKCHCN